jgi:hypothetical protein
MGRKRFFWGVLVAVVVFLAANLLYFAKWGLRWDLFAGRHFGQYFPLAEVAERAVSLPKPALAFSGQYNRISRSEVGNVSGEIASGWQDASIWGPAEIEYRRVSLADPPGVVAQQVRVKRLGPNAACQLVQIVAPEAGRRYRMSVTLRSDRPARFRLRLRERTSPYRACIESSAEVGTEWKTIRAKGSCDSHCLTDGIAYFVIQTDDVCTFQVRSASLIPIS